MRRWDFFGFFGCPTVFFTASSGVLRRFLQFLGRWQRFSRGGGFRASGYPGWLGVGAPARGLGTGWLGWVRAALKALACFGGAVAGTWGAGLFVPWLELEIRDEYLLMAEPLTF